MKKAYIAVLSVVCALGITGCGKEKEQKTTEATEVSTELTTEEQEHSASESTEEIIQALERVYDEACIGVFTISINPEIDLEIDKDAGKCYRYKITASAENATGA